MEYIAVFLAVLFPGALLAFNHELLQALSKVSALRIYCAGIWHNAVLCAVCAWALFLQPLILYPLYIHDEGPMVLEVSPTSPLSGHLSPGDVIISLDDFRINNAQEWSQIIDVLTERSYQTFQNHSLLENSMKRSIGKGYCIPYSLVEEGKHVSLEGNRTCPDELSAFITIPCSDQAMLDDDSLAVNHQRDGGVFHCFYDKDVLKLEKCGDGWGRLHSNRSSCLCSKVYFLDGEAISEVISQYFRILCPRRKRTILQYFLFGGTVASIIMFVRIFLVLL